MGTSRDVRDILELGQAPGPPAANLSLQPPRRSGAGPPDPRHKRPDGITRELYALIGDNAPSLALAQAVKPKFKERVKRSGPSVKWQWVPFTNPARADPIPGEEGDKEKDTRKKLRLSHWVRDLPPNHVEGAPDFKFHKFNTSSQPYSYTNEEYTHYLRGESWRKGAGAEVGTANSVVAEDDWPREETDHLFALAHRYDLRFVVMADRWDYPTERTVDVRDVTGWATCEIRRRS